MKSSSSENIAKGFTIVELLIVIVVIGILAAITIVAYNGVQNRATDTTVQSDLNNFAKQLGMYQAENGAYPVTLSSALGIKFNRSSYSTAQNNVYYCADAAGAAYSLTVLSRSGKMFVMSSANGLATYTGGWGGSTTCTVNGFASTDFRSHGYNTATTPNWQGWVAS